MRRLVLLIATLSVVLAPAARAQEGESTMEFSLRLANAGQSPNFLGDLQDNCTLLFARGVTGGGRSRWLYARGSGPAVGTLDVARGTGEVYNKASGWQLEALPPNRPRPTVLDDLGVALDGREAYLTGRVTRGRSLLSACAASGSRGCAGPSSKPGRCDRRGQPVPNSFSSLVTGTLTMLPAMSRAIDRPRCRNRAKNPRSRRLPAGYELGRFSFEFRPGEAKGLEGSARLTVEPGAEGVGFEPGAGATRDAAGRVITPITSGFPVPLSCALGQECLMSGGRITLGGGFDLVRGDRRVSVTDLALATTGEIGAPRRTITGVLDGTPLTVGEGEGYFGVAFTPEFSERAGAALGTELFGGITIAPEFTALGA